MPETSHILHRLTMFHSQIKLNIECQNILPLIGIFPCPSTEKPTTLNSDYVEREGAIPSRLKHHSWKYLTILSKEFDGYFLKSFIVI